MGFRDGFPVEEGADERSGEGIAGAYYGIPVLDQFNLQGINRFNAPIYYKEDLLHMNEDGYRKIGPVQAAFIANGF